MSGESAGGGPAIIVMAKAPRHGTVKTRLSRAYPEAEIVALASCFLADTISTAKQAGPRVIVAYSPEDGRAVIEPLIEPILGNGVLWICQQGADLGARMHAAFVQGFARGYAPLVMVGTDSPTLPLASYQAALETLQSGEADVVLGPAEDGGFTLIGVSALSSVLFEGVLWSSPTVFQQTKENSERAGLRVRETEPWYDIDTPEDLKRLRKDLLTGPGGEARAPATCRWLSKTRHQDLALRPGDKMPL